MSIETRDPRMASVLQPGASVERLATGFEFTEGPIWNPPANQLIFSDMPGDQMRCWSSEDGIVVFRKPSNMANGNCYNSLGHIITCEHATSRVTRTDANGVISVLASHYDGKQLNSPNDVIVDQQDRALFTDPTFGRMKYYGVPREPELDFRGVFRIESNGKLTLLADDFDQPNGLCLSADGKRLFVNDTMRRHIREFAVADDGSVSGGEVWVEVSGERDGAPDGMKLNSAGELFCTGPGGIHVFDQQAVCLGVILVPEVVANFTWGGYDLKDLFITASRSLYRVRVTTPGIAAF
jgi:gluconolactonase